MPSNRHGDALTGGAPRLAVYVAATRASLMLNMRLALTVTIVPFQLSGELCKLAEAGS